MTRPVIGIGTGRCGTVSLQKILDGCHNAQVTHEHENFRVKFHNSDRSPLKTLIGHCQSSSKYLRGEVASYWLPHIMSLREAIPNLGVIALKRQKKTPCSPSYKSVPGIL